MSKLRRHPSTPDDFLRHHGLSIASVAIVLTWIALCSYADPKTHLGSFFGNAIADWTGVAATVIATKYFYEIGSSESKKPKRIYESRFLEAVRDHFVDNLFGFYRNCLGLLVPEAKPRGEMGAGHRQHRV